MTIRIAATHIFQKDAVGNFCYDLYSVFLQSGLDAKLYSRGRDKDSPILDYQEIFSDFKLGDVLFFHHFVYDPFFPELIKLPGKKIAYFHGITPPDLLRPHQETTAQDCEKGLAQLSLLAHFDVICVNSVSTQKQLLSYFKTNLTIHVLPPIIASRSTFVGIQKKAHTTQDQKILLCVGRIVPHKKIEDVLAIFHAFRAQFSWVSLKLKIIGMNENHAYEKKIQDLIVYYGLTNDVLWDGLVDDEALVNAYAQSDCYILMSEHEGFGVTLLEALKADLPILAYQKHAIQDVLGDSGCQVIEKNPDHIAKKLYAILFDQDYREKMLEKQRNRLSELMQLCDQANFVNLVKMECLL